MASKSQQYSKRRFAESSPQTIVGLQKTDVQCKKMMDSLERQQNTAVNNIANHQQAMKMSWRRLEERRAQSPTMNRQEMKKEVKKEKKGLMLQSNTKLFVNKTSEIYDPDNTLNKETAAVDDSELSIHKERPVTHHGMK